MRINIGPEYFHVDLPTRDLNLTEESNMKVAEAKTWVKSYNV